jgi:hypothetical protein
MTLFQILLLIILGIGAIGIVTIAVCVYLGLGLIVAISPILGAVCKGHLERENAARESLPCGICGKQRSDHIGRDMVCPKGYSTNKWNPYGERDFRLWPREDELKDGGRR